MADMIGHGRSKPPGGQARIWLALFLLWLGISPLSAHPLGLSVTAVTVEAAATMAEVNLAAEDLEAAIGRGFYDPQAGQIPAERLAAVLPALQGYLAERIVLRSSEGPCPAAPARITTEGHVVRAELRWPCGQGHEALTLVTTLLAGTKPDFVQHVLVLRGELQFDLLLRDGRSEVALYRAEDPWRVAGQYVLSGIEHIFIGLDHIAFLVGLLLWATRVVPVVKVVTAFTLAHTVTLSLAVLDIVHVPAWIVEPLIALTVIWVAVENFLSRDIERRWRLAMTLGLIHGFGFAGVLQEYGLPPGSVPLALGAFNVGVEIGQLGIVMLLMPALWLLDQLWPTGEAALRRQPIVVHAGSVALALFGAWWLAERTIL